VVNLITLVRLSLCKVERFS